MHLVGTKIDHSQRHVWFTYVALVLMNIMDVVYTDAILAASAKESNPFMNHLYQNFGMVGIIAVKAFFLIVLGFTIKYIPNLHAFYCNLFYLGVMVYALLTAYHVYWFFGFG